MKLFTPGPVTMGKSILDEGGKQHPYFRTKVFSKLMLNIQDLITEFIYCNKGSVVPLGASGTGAIDCAFTNLIEDNDSILIINNGTFGQRLVEISEFYNFNYINYIVPFGKEPDLQIIEKYIVENSITVIITQGTETSSSQKIPVKEIGLLSKKYNTFFIVDAITAFLIDKYNMDNSFIDVSILSSQKGFCVPPGVSFLVLNPKAVTRLDKIKSKSFYFNIKDYLKNMERGQTPYSPPITILHQIETKLLSIKDKGLDTYLSEIDIVAKDLRKRMSGLPFIIVANNPSNTLTSYRYSGINRDFDAYELFNNLMEEHNIYITPVGGEYAKSDIRIAHIGNLTIDDNKILVDIIKNYPNI